MVDNLPEQQRGYFYENTLASTLSSEVQLTESQTQFEQLTAYLTHFVPEEMPEYQQAAERNPDDITQIWNYMKVVADGMGGLGLDISKEFGGHGLTTVQTAKLTQMEAYGSAALDLSTRIVGDTLTLKPLEISITSAPHTQEQYDQRKEIMKELGKGDTHACFALTEPQHGSDAVLAEFRATETVRDGQKGFLLNGTKRLITNAEGADYVVLVARTNKENPGQKGLSAILVDLHTPQEAGEVHFAVTGRFNKAGQVGGAILNEMKFNNFFVPETALLGEKDNGWEQVIRPTLFNSRIEIAAQGLGLMKRAFDEAFTYANTRKSFNKPLIEYPEIAGQLAMMERQVRICDYLVNKAAQMQDNQLNGLPNQHVEFWASLAKLIAGESAKWVADGAQAISGGMGYVIDFEPAPHGSETIIFDQTNMPPPIIARLASDAEVIRIYEGASSILKKFFVLPYLNKRQLTYLRKHVADPKFHWDSVNELDSAEKVIETIERFLFKERKKRLTDGIPQEQLLQQMGLAA